MMNYRYRLCIAGMQICILSPREIQFPESYLPFLTEGESTPPEWEIEVFFGSKNIPCSDGDRITRFPRRDADDFVRMEPADREMTCRLFIPEDMADSFCQHGNWTMLLQPERLLLPYDRVILHASAVLDGGEAILFTAPSDGGKSTQAANWEKTFGSEIINGDKVMIHATETPVGYGSPVAGSSGIYKNVGAPVRAIVYLHKAPENRVERLDERHAFMVLYGQAVKTRRDEAFNRALLPLIARIAATVPVLELYCTPDSAAAHCLRDWMADNLPSPVSLPPKRGG